MCAVIMKKVGQMYYYKFERISVMVTVVMVVVVVVLHSTYTLYSSTRIILSLMVPDAWWCAPHAFVFSFVNGVRPPTWAASAGPENPNPEVYRDTIDNVCPIRDGKYFSIKSPLRGRDGFNWNSNLSRPAVCVRVVLQYRSRGNNPLITICGF